MKNIIFKFLLVSDPRLAKHKETAGRKEDGKVDEQEDVNNTSTLELFARAGGLHELSKHMYLYQQSLARLLGWSEWTLNILFF